MSVSRKRVLVVAQDAPLRETRVMLLSAVGYTVTSVSSDDDALRLLETDRFDLVLLGRSSELSEGIDSEAAREVPIAFDSEDRRPSPERIPLKND